MNTKNETDSSVKKSEVALREEAVQAFWEEHDIFKKSLETPAGSAPVGDFVFYDGPPFATGLPHYGHILAGTIKDAVPRFWTMNGYRVRRKWGWDCHGLPLENLIEKKLGLATKRDIEEYGVQNFNEAARDAVLEFADDWRRIIPRMGRFVDMEDDYKTMDASYTESVWWVFSELNKKGLVYEGFKGMHLCPRCGTTLSNFEVNQGYKDIKDISVTVKLPLLDDSGNPTDTSLLVWTTTPWTLPGNMAAAVHKDIVYVKFHYSQAQTIEEGGEYNFKEEVQYYVVAKERLDGVIEGPYVIDEEMRGADLVGKSYEPPFPYWKDKEFENKENAWKIYHAEYVELGDEGTGAVHIAPAYGEEDMELAKEHNVPIQHHVDAEGHFKDFVTDFAGKLVKPKDDDNAGVTHLDADIEIVKALKERGVLFKKENITHSYPHCWRCDTPLLNYATTSWFVDVPKIKDVLVEENSKVHWVPDHVGSSRFGKWLEGAREWAVSRQRYWGAPLPIWQNPNTKEYKIFGSLAELQEYVPKSGNTYFTMRHGQSESNVAGVTSPDIHADDGLTETGRTQVTETIEDLKSKKIDLIISSPFLRTKETAEMVQEALGLSGDQLIYDKRISEIQTGEFGGNSVEAYHEFLSSGAKWCDCKPIDGESWFDVKRRVGAFLYEIDTTYKDKNILIVSHNSPLRMLGTVHDGRHLRDTDFDHDAEGKRYNNAEVRSLPFAQMPHNDDYALDFHRPYIDDFVVVDEDGTQLKRIPDVFDCWFESGSMPYAETHYPFENLDIADMEKGIRFPADFISEAVDQTRGWFYSLMVLGVALFGKAPFNNVITNGLVLAEDGKKMSKKLQNYPDPVELVARQGADVMRFYLLSSSIIKGEDLNFSEKEVQELQRKNIGRLHNVLAMYLEYAGGETARDDSNHVLDKWIIARLNELIAASTAGFKNYELDRATRPVTDFIDDLSVWYLRRSRDRLKGEDIADKEAALATLRYVLQNLALVMAPSMPFYAEHLWQAVKPKDGAESVHLAAWPKEKQIDTEVLQGMTVTREVVSIALEQRAKAGIKVRQPLASLQVHNVPKEFWQIIKDEVNVKELKVSVAVTPNPVVLDLKLSPALVLEGDARDFIRAVQDMRKKTGLQQKDRITIMVQTSDGGEAVITEFKDDIQKTVGADAINFGDANGEEIVAGEHSFTVEIKKV